MPHDPLAKAAARRHELTRSRAVQALREIDRADTPVTFAGVAQAAGISRSWLYTQPDISGQIRRLREKRDGTGAVPPASGPPTRRCAPGSPPPSTATKQLADENTRLRRQLARALGDQRSARTRSGNDPQSEQSGSSSERPVGNTVHNGTPQVTASSDAKAQDNVRGSVVLS